MDDESDKRELTFTFWYDKEELEHFWEQPDPESGMTEEEKVWHRLKYGPPQKADIEAELANIMGEELKKRSTGKYLAAL